MQTELKTKRWSCAVLMEDVWSVSDALEILREMKSQGVAFNKDTYMLAFATCYKLVGMA